MRTEYAGLVDASFIGQTVTLFGWVHRRRDHGGVIFIDLRDREGLVQVVCDPDLADVFAAAEKVRSEYCLEIIGTVRRRPEGTTNTALVSGEIEVLCQQLTILNPSVPIPFQLDDDNLSETTRLTHRVLDLRRPAMQKNMMLRYRVTMAVRKYLDAAGFIDIETPMLTRSTPEGARDYLVPSRVHPGAFFALPQSPQLFKQLLMVAGFDRYYQIVKCFRDEDLRADRQPEFTQIDIETSFLDEAEIRHMMEQMIRVVFDEVLAVKLPRPFPVMTHADAMRLYGSDKPDLRISLQLTELTDVMRDVEFKVFKAATEMKDGKVFALRIPGGGEMPRSEIDGYTDFVKIYGAKGLAYIKVNQAAQGRAGLQSPIIKNLHDSALAKVIERTGARDGDLIFFGADRAKIVYDALGALRAKIGHSEFGRTHGLLQEGWQPLWVVDFPMFEFDEEAQRYVAAHHPFTSPKDGHEDRLATDPAQAMAKAYDMVLNGWEMGGGSIRIHSEDVQSKVFRALKISAEEAGAKFGFLLDALQYGAPPHGGIAFGLDRLVAMMAGAESIRDVIAFPKTQRAQDLLTQAPSEVDEKQLRELHIRVRSEAKTVEPSGVKRAQDRMKIPESVLVVIYTPALDALIIERADHPGFWQSVTGSKAALDEPLRTVCVRELAEETGLSVSAERLDDWKVSHSFAIYEQWRHRYATGVTHNTEHVFGLCWPHRFEPRLNPLEHTRYRWLAWRDAADACFSWTNAESIRRLGVLEANRSA